MPRPMPVMSSALESPNSGPSSFSICVFSHRSSRACTASRGAPESRSSAMMRNRGCSASSAATSFATASPVQRMVPSEVSTNWSSGAAASFVARASISLASTCWAAACNALASEPASAASGAKVNPSSRPIAWPSTITSPVLPISVFKTEFSRRRRINTLVRRSTKRSVSRSCSASDNLFSTSRAIPCQ